MIYFKVGEDVKELEDTPQMREAINLDKQIATQAGLVSEVYDDENLPDEIKLSLGKITQQQLDENKAEAVKQNRIGEIKSRLLEIDQDCIRSLRAIGAKKGKPEDDAKLKTLDDEADLLRDELTTLEGAK